MISQAPLNFPDAGSTEPRRPTPVLIAAGLVGVLAILVILIVLFSGGGGGTPTPSPSVRPSGSGPAGTGSPGPTATPNGSTSPTTEPTLAPGAIDEMAAEICAEPVPPYDALRPSLLSGFGEYCEEAVATVLREDGIDLTAIEQAGWAFTAGDGDVEGSVTVSRVYIDLTGERRIRNYRVSHDQAGGAALVGNRTLVRRINDPLLIFRWTAP